MYNNNTFAKNPFFIVDYEQNLQAVFDSYNSLIVGFICVNRVNPSSKVYMFKPAAIQGILKGFLFIL